MSDFTIDVARDFSPVPYGRYPSEGPDNAERFREEQLIPAIKQHNHVVVDLSGYLYYGSSFLEETFAGLIRAGFTPDELIDKVTVIHERLPSVVLEAEDYLKGEEPLSGLRHLPHLKAYRGALRDSRP